MNSLLRVPARDLLDGYTAALERGWSPDNLRPQVAQEQLAAIQTDPQAFLARMDDPAGKGPPVTLPDGSQVPRLPSLRRWIWQDGFCGSIGLRWQAGTDALPPTCLGHIGYAVVPWRRREGLATKALNQMLPIARIVGLRCVDLTVSAENIASIGVIKKAGGKYIHTFETPAALGSASDFLYRIDL